MLKVNVHAFEDGQARFDCQRTGDELETSPLVEGGSIVNEGTEWFIIEVTREGGVQDGDDWIAEVRIDVSTVPMPNAM